MPRRLRLIGCLCLLFVSFLASPSLLTHAAIAHTIQKPALTDFPTVDPDYIYNQLAYTSSSFPKREAGYDKNLPVSQNGHDEFAAYWAQEISKNLQGFNPQTRNDKFTISGWSSSRPAVVPAFNVEVSVKGSTAPQEIVVIGCHYDGMYNSTESAFDDASGCAIELGVAKALGAYWTSHHKAPSRTIRFVAFDAEEQGIYGSEHYVNTTIKSELNNVVAMVNEEQNGIGYPIRYQANTKYPILPFFNYMTPVSKGKNSTQTARINKFRSLLGQSYTPVFAQMQALGYTSATDTNSSGQTVTRSIFGSNDLKYIQAGDDTLGSSDQVPFTNQGIACSTLATNHDYYDNKQPWSYPYDQPQDKLSLMNSTASGQTTKAPTLVAALALPGMITTWVLNQPDYLG